MPDRTQLTYQIGIGAVVTTLALGTCATNAHIGEIAVRMDDGFQNIHRRIDDTNRRIDDTNQHLHELNRRVDDTNRRIDDTNQRIDDTNQRINDLQGEVQDLRRLVETGRAAN